MFRRKKKDKPDEQVTNQRIKEILSEERILKEDEYKHGRIYLTENYLIWEKKSRTDNAIIPIKSIQRSEQATKLRVGSCLRVVYGEDETEILFPFMSDRRLSSGQLDDIKQWIVSLKLGPSIDVFDDIIYSGGHTAHPEKHTGQLIVTPTTFTFQEIKRGKPGDFKLEILIERIEKVSVQTTSEISRLTTVLVGPLWGMGFPLKSKFVLVEYEDDMDMKQTPLFDFPLDRGDKKKGRVMRTIHDHLTKIRPKKTEEKLSEVEDPLKILKTRFVKGEITKEEYSEMKKLLEE